MGVSPAMIKQVGKWISDNKSTSHGDYLQAVSEDLVEDSTWYEYEDIPYGVKFQAIGGPGYDDIVFVKLSDGTLLNFGSNFFDRSIPTSPTVLNGAERYMRFWD